MKEKLLHRGSVKDIYQLSESELLFRFSNRYSIFDWGEMPDAIEGKGKSLALLGRKLMSALSEAGFPTHYLHEGQNAEDIVVKAVTVPRDQISIYQTRPSNILIPLEVIYRFGAPKGSSLLKRFKTEAEWKAAGFDRAYQEGEYFSELKVDFTTKLEKMDRVLTDTEAQSLAGMNAQEWKDLKLFTQAVAQKLKAIFDEAEMKLWDGKFEFAFDQNRKIMLVDSIGLDEIRLTYQGSPLSKEILRQFYTGSAWTEALAEAKLKSPNDFKNYCLQKLGKAPLSLSASVLGSISDLYQTVSELVLPEPGSDVKALHAKLSQTLKQLMVRT